MKIMKRITAFLACVCMMVCLVPTVAYAANGELRFSDPETTVGAKFEVTAKLSADDAIASGNATLEYDTDYLRFVSGDGVTESDGQLMLTGTGTGSPELNWTITFQALAEGTTVIEILTATGSATDGDSIQITQGTSTVTIGPGDPSLIEDEAEGTSVTGVPVEVNGVSYTVSTKFSDALVPEGFTKTEVTYEGQTCEAAIQESSGKYVMLLATDDGSELFFLYDPDNGSFTPFCQMYVSDSRYIILLSEDKSSELPSYLQKTTMTIDEQEFIAWQNTESSEYYVVYALNSDGKLGYYQYDTVDGTYQRYTPEAVEVEEVATTPLDKLLEKVEENLLLVILVAAFLIVFLFFILIIVAIKLRHRNLELDDIYDEYDIDLDDDEEEEEEPVKAKKEKKGLFKKKAKDEEDFDDFDDYDDEYDDEDDYEDDDFDAYDDEDDDIDDLDEVLNTRVRKPVPRQTSKAATNSTARQASKPASKPAAKSAPRQASKPAVKPAAPRPVAPTVEKPAPMRGHMELDDTFKMDIIDLD